MSRSHWFSGGPGSRLEQGTYTIEHEALGQTALFLVPVARAGRKGNLVIKRSSTES